MTKTENPAEKQIDNTPEDKTRPNSQSDSQLESIAEDYLNLWQDNIKLWSASPNPPETTDKYLVTQNGTINP